MNSSPRASQRPRVTIVRHCGSSWRPTAQGIGVPASITAGSRLHAALHDAGGPCDRQPEPQRRSQHPRDRYNCRCSIICPTPASIVTICVGGNDLVANPYAPRLTRRPRRLAEAAPRGSILCTLPAPSFSPTARYVNAVRRAATEHGHLVAELGAHLLPTHRAVSRSLPPQRPWLRRGYEPSEPMGIDPDLVPQRGTLTSATSDPEGEQRKRLGERCEGEGCEQRLAQLGASQPMNSSEDLRGRRSPGCRSTRSTAIR